MKKQENSNKIKQMLNKKIQKKDLEFLNLFSNMTKKTKKNENDEKSSFLKLGVKNFNKKNLKHPKKLRTKETLALSHFQTFWHSKTYTIFQELIKKKVHIGQHKKYLNTNMVPYLFGYINDFCMIDLNHTIKQLRVALKLLYETVLNGGNVAIIGTKNSHLDHVEVFANYLGLPYMASTKWLGGSLTNFDIIEKNFEKQQRNKKNTLSESNFSNINLQSQKKLNLFRGLENMGPSDILIILNPLENQVALNEARVLGLPVIGIVDTHTPFNLIDYPIVANNESLISLSYFLQLFNLIIRSALKKKVFLETILKKKKNLKNIIFLDIMVLLKSKKKEKK